MLSHHCHNSLSIKVSLVLQSCSSRPVRHKLHIIYIHPASTQPPSRCTYLTVALCTFSVSLSLTGFSSPNPPTVSAKFPALSLDPPSGHCHSLNLASWPRSSLLQQHQGELIAIRSITISSYSSYKLSALRTYDIQAGFTADFTYPAPHDEPHLTAASAQPGRRRNANLRNLRNSR